jgi:hypothetical protein
MAISINDNSCKLFSSALALALAMTVAGCGSTVADDDEAASGTGAGGSGSGASGSGASGGSGGTTSSSGSGGGEQCAAFADQPGSGAVTVRFRNDSPMPIYLPASCSYLQYDIRPQSGDDGTTYAYDLSCVQTCEVLQTEPQYLCDACAPSLWVLPAGATHDVGWTGTGIQSATMPTECYFEGQAFGDSCTQVVTAPANTYRVEAIGYQSCEGDCVCEEDGQCWGNAAGLQALPDVTEFQHPGTSMVEVVFGPCAFGCPPDPDDG